MQRNGSFGNTRASVSKGRNNITTFGVVDDGFFLCMHFNLLIRLSSQALVENMRWLLLKEAPQL